MNNAIDDLYRGWKSYILGFMYQPKRFSPTLYMKPIVLKAQSVHHQ
jgi:hypothetical protein